MRNQVWAKAKDRKQKCKNKIQNSDQSKMLQERIVTKNQMKIGNRTTAGVIDSTIEIVRPETTIEGTKTEIARQTTMIGKISRIIDKGTKILILTSGCITSMILSFTSMLFERRSHLMSSKSIFSLTRTKEVKKVQSVPKQPPLPDS